MARDVPYVGVCFSPKILPNTPWYEFLNKKSNAVTPPNPIPSSLGNNISTKTYGFRTHRGRTYELGRIEAGTCDIKVDNTDGSFNPNNTSSTYYPDLLPFRPVRINCAYPITGNILNDTNLSPIGSDSSRISVGATDGDFSAGIVNWYTVSGTAPTLAGGATYGSNIMQVSFNSTVALDVPIVSGKTITVSMYMAYDNPSGISSNFKVYDGGYYTGATPLATTNFTNGSQTLTRYTATVTPQNSRVTITITNGSGSGIPQIDGIQVEFGSAATAFSTSGSTIYDLFNGFVERYPQSFQAPNRGETNLVATDAIASMSQVQLQSFYQAQVLTDTSPALYYYPMSDNDGSITAANNSAFNQLPLTKRTLNLYTSNVTFGDKSAETGVIGGNTTGVTTYTLGGSSGYTLQGTYLANTAIQDIQFAVGDTYTFSFWVSATATSFPNYFMVANYFGDESANQQASNLFGIGVNGAGRFMCFARSAVAGEEQFASTTAITAADWYFLSLAVTYTGGNTYTLAFTVNDTTITNNWTNGAENIVVQNVYYGGYGNPLFTAGTTFAHATIHRGSITPANYYAVGAYAQHTNSIVPEQTGTRFANTLKYFSGFSSEPVYSDLGVSQMLQFSPTGTQLVEYLQNIADTEGGEWYIDGEGYITFKDRHSRLEKLYPKVTFGDGAGEVPYEGGESIFAFDPTYVYNDITVSRANGVVVNAQDQASITKYFPRSYERAIYNTANSEAVDAAYFLLSRYKEPQVRVEKIVLTPARNPAVWPTALGIEIGDLLRVNKRPLGSAAISVDCFVESVEHNYDGQSGDWVTTISLSPLFRYYWNLSTVSLRVNTASSANTLVVTKSLSTLKRASDIIAGQMLQMVDANNNLTTICVVSGIPTETSTTITVPIQDIGWIDSGLIGYSASTLSDSIPMDSTSTVNLTTTALSGTSGSYLIDSEIITGSVTGSVLTITARAQNSTLQTAAGTNSLGGTSLSHLSGTAIYYIANTGIVPTSNSTATEILPNQISRKPYAIDTVSRDAFSILGSWTATLNTGTYSATGGTTKYNTFTVNPIADFLNYPQSDLCVGQLLSLGSENLAVVKVSQPTSTANWQLSAYKVTQSAATLSADIGIDETILTVSSAVTANAILIDNEFMVVLAGSGTTTLTVARGRPTLADWTILNGSTHKSGATIYTIVNAGCSGTYSANSAIIEGYNKTTAVTGTARLGY